MDLSLGLLEAEEQHDLSTFAGGIGETRPDGRLPGARRPADKDTAAPEHTLTAKHVIQPRHAGRDPLGADLLVQAKRGDWQHLESLGTDQERVLVSAVV